MKKSADVTLKFSSNSVENEIKVKLNAVPVDEAASSELYSVEQVESSCATLIDSIKSNIDLLTLTLAVATTIPISVATVSINNLVENLEYLKSDELWLLSSASSVDGEFSIHFDQVQDVMSKKVNLLLLNHKQESLLVVGAITHFLKNASLPMHVIQWNLQASRLGIGVFDNSDVHSAAQMILEGIPMVQNSQIIILVQQAVYELFAARFEQQYKSLIRTSDNISDAKANILGEMPLSKDVLDVEKLYDDLHERGINIIQFRTVAEFICLIDHASHFDGISIQSSNLTLGLELSKSIKNCAYFWLNSFLTHHKSVHGFRTNPRISLPTTTSAFNKITAAEGKWAALSNLERFALMRRSLKKANFSPGSIHNIFKSAVIDVDNKFSVIKHQHADGLIVIESDGKSVQVEKKVFRTALFALLAGNGVILRKNSEELDKLIANSEIPQGIVRQADSLNVDHLRSVRITEKRQFMSQTWQMVYNTVVWVPSGNTISFAK